MCESLSYSIITAIYANGNIKKYELIVSGIQLLNFPISYILLKLGVMPYWTIATFIFTSLCCLIIRLFIAKTLINIKVKDFFSEVCIKVTIVSLLSALLPFWIKNFFNDNFISFICMSFITMIYTLIIVYIVGCNIIERALIHRAILSMVKKITAHKNK